MKQRKLLDYELFGKQAENNNKTYQFITTMQEIKLQVVPYEGAKNIFVYFHLID